MGRIEPLVCFSYLKNLWTVCCTHPSYTRKGMPIY